MVNIEEDEILDLFAAEDTIADYEYHLTHRGNLSPEKTLMLSVFIEGLVDFLSNPKSKHFKAAEEWIYSSENNYLFSYLNIAREFDLNAVLFREKLLKLKGNRYLAKKRVKALNSVFTWKPNQNQEK